MEQEQSRKPIVCEHLAPLEQEVRQKGVRVQSVGQSGYSSVKGSSIYFDCFLIKESLVKRFSFPEFVEWEEYFGFAAGQEAGFFCKNCESSVYGYHPLMKNNKYVAESIPDFI